MRRVHWTLDYYIYVKSVQSIFTSCNICEQKFPIILYFSPMFHFYTPWKGQNFVNFHLITYFFPMSPFNFPGKHQKNQSSNNKQQHWHWQIDISIISMRGFIFAMHADCQQLLESGSQCKHYDILRKYCVIWELCKPVVQIM